MIFDLLCFSAKRFLLNGGLAMSQTTALNSLGTLVVSQLLGQIASGADAANAIGTAAQSIVSDIAKAANNIMAGADLASIAASSVAIFKQYSALAGNLAVAAGSVGVFANVAAILDKAITEGPAKIDTNSIVGTVAGIVSTVAAAGVIGGAVLAAPEVTALGILAIGLTISAQTNLGTLGSNAAWLENTFSTMADAIKPYYDSLSTDAQAAFQGALTNTVQSTLNGGMLVPEIDSDGLISGYSMQVPISVVQQDDGSTVSYFNGGVGVVTPAPGDNSTGPVWTIPQPGSDTPATIYTDGNGGYKYSSTDSDQNNILLEKSGDDSGSAQNEEMVQTSPNGDVNANIGGTGAVADLSNATVTLAPDAQANVTGTGNTFAIDSGASLVSQAPDGASGSQQGNQFTLSSGAILIDYEGNSTVADIITQAFGSTGANVTLSGGIATTELSGATITTQNGTTLTVVGDNNCVDGNCTVAIDGDGNQFTLHAGDIASINGNDNTANAVGDGAQLSVAGANNSVDATDGIITLDNGTSTTLTGDDNQLSVGSDVAATIAGTDNTGTLTGSGSTITAGDDFTLSMASGSNNDSISVGISGIVNIATGDQGEVVNLASGIINLGSDVGVTSDGVGGNTINAGAGDRLTASNDTISFSGGGDSISGAGDAISASGDTLNISNYNGASDVITGDNNTVTSSWSDVTLDGANESLTGTYDVLALSGLGERVSGDNNSISFGAGTTASVTSYGDSINLGAGSSLTSNGEGNNTIFATSDDALVLGSTWGTASPYMDTLHVSDDQNITLGSGSAYNLIGSGNALNAGEGDLLIASNDAISFAGSSGSVSGSGDMILASNATLSISNYNAPSDVVTGDNNA
ncbi:beta strand repeat-containing protein, partial [Pseudomonas sp. MWU13-2105]|uniref:beta strand repeat-containing protein n=1 Tax=Pseudomonas sp. MWU13-2105 TaxID=2935074 RepID=UPI00200CF420